MGSTLLLRIGCLLITAVPALAQFSQLSIVRTGTGNGRVIGTAPGDPPITFTCPAVCVRTFGGGTTVTLTAEPDPGTAFEWSGPGTTLPETPLVRTVVLPFFGNVTVTATFGTPVQTLNLSRTGSGTISASGPGVPNIVCPATCSGNFAVGSTVALQATPAVADTAQARTRMVWTGPVIDGGDPRQRTVVMPGGGGTVSVGASFIQQFNLDLQVFGSGRVASTSSGVAGGIDCANSGDPASSTSCQAFFDQTAQFPQPTYVMLMATPEPGWRVAWTGDAVTSGNAFVNPANPNQCQVSFLFAAQSLQARFTRIPPGVFVTKSGVGLGSVTSIPTGINCGTDCEELTGLPGFAPGDVITLRATAASGSVFVGWTGDGTSLFDPREREVRILADTVHAVSARFEPIRLTLTKSGPGQGTVTTVPPGSLNCSAGCSSAALSLAAPQLVTLTNVPVAPWFAAGWAVGGVTYSGDSITLNVMGPTNVVALYSYRPGAVHTAYAAPSSPPAPRGAGVVTAMEALPGCRLLVADGRVLRVPQSGFNGVESPGFHLNAVNGFVTALRRLTNGPEAGKVIVGGSFTEVDTAPPGGTEVLPRVGLMRLLPDGAVDPAFTTATPGVVLCLLQQADGKVLVGGAFSEIGGISQNGLARLNSDGSIDPSFGSPVLLNSLGTAGSVRSMSFQTVGGADYLLIAGDFVSVGGVPRPGVARLNRGNGQLDETFDPPAFYSVVAGNAPNIILVQPDNRILVAGNLPVPTGAPRTNLFRLTEAGALDSTFSRTNMGSGEIFRLAVEPNGKIVVVGEFTEIGGEPDATPIVPPVTRNRIARFLSNGMLDQAFSPGTGANFNVNDVIALPNGRLVVGGRFTSIDGKPDTVHLARLYGDPPHDPLPCEVPLRPLRVQVSPGGGGLVDYGPAGSPADHTCHSDCTTEYFDGVTVELSATPASGAWTFAGWTVDGQPASGNPLLLNIAGLHEVTAIFNGLTQPLTVTKTGDQGTISSSPPGIICDPACHTQTASFNQGQRVTLTAGAQPGYVFTGWSGGGCSGTSACTVTMDSAKEVTATFTLARVLDLTVVGNGSVASSPPGVACSAACLTEFADGTVVTLTPTADVGFAFAGWEGPDACPGLGPCTVSMTANREVLARFDVARRLTVQVEGNGFGTVTSVDGRIDCGQSCVADYALESTVTLRATPANDAMGVPSEFAGWSGGGCSGLGDCVVTMDEAKTVTANFVYDPVLVTLFKSGRGSVVSTVGSLSCGAGCATASVYFTRTQPVSLDAAPAVGWQVSWTVGGVAQSPSVPNTLPLDLLAVVGGTLAVSATFEPVLAITGQSPANVGLCPGGIVTLFVDAIEPEGFTVEYVWRRNGDVVLGETSRTLVTDQAGVYTARLTLAGGGGGGSINTSPITVAPNQPPIATDDRLLALVGTLLVIPPAALTVNDTDPEGQPLRVESIDGAATHGSLSRSDNDTIAYIAPASGATDTFNYTVTDGSCTDVASVSIRFVTSPTPVVNGLGLVFHLASEGLLLPFNAPSAGTFVLERAPIATTPLAWTEVARVTTTAIEVIAFADRMPLISGAIYRVRHTEP